MQHSEILQHPMSANYFQMLGINYVAYVKQLNKGEGSPRFAVYSANGVQIALVEGDRDVAFATVRQHDMEPVSLH